MHECQYLKQASAACGGFEEVTHFIQGQCTHGHRRRMGVPVQVSKMPVCEKKPFIGSLRSSSKPVQVQADVQVNMHSNNTQFH
jgi:hypothetical protein